MTRTLPLAQLLPDVSTIASTLNITGLTQDSREVRPGDAFIAIAGFGTHGLYFAEDALKQGAAAVLYEPPLPADISAPSQAIAVPHLRARLGAMADQFYDQPSQHMRVIGVTGTSGKTSIVQFLAQALETLGVCCGSIGTLGAGLSGELISTGFTTPLVLKIHALLAQLRDAGAKVALMEVSSHALDQGRVDGVRFEIAVFSNLSRDHLDYHADMQDYFAAKAQLFQRESLRTAVINLDDDFGATLPAQLSPQVNTITVSSKHADANITARDIVLNERGIGFNLVIGEAAVPVESMLLGRFNLDNLLLVAGVLHSFEYSPTQIAAALNALTPVPGRMNRFGGSNGLPLVVVDYSHKPDALEQALVSLRGHSSGKLVCVFGCGGERDTGKRPLMAAIAERHADKVIVTDDNPRGEDGDGIVRDILAGFSNVNQIVLERDRTRAIETAINTANAGDIVLIAGKGHETYQEISGVKHPFNDATQAQAALLARGVQA